MKQYIVITYKNGSSITIDVPENFYREHYKNYSDKKLNQVFLKEYKNFVAALSKDTNMVVSVGKYLKFSNATISGKNVLCVDIKCEEDVTTVTSNENSIFVPGVHDKVYLDLTETRLETLLDKIEKLNLVENVDKLLQKLVSYFNKSNLEFTLKAGKKPTAPPVTRKKKADVADPTAAQEITSNI